MFFVFRMDHEMNTSHASFLVFPRDKVYRGSCLLKDDDKKNEAKMFQASVKVAIQCCSCVRWFRAWGGTPYLKKTGELKASQHLGLARLASQQDDRVGRLSLPPDTNILSFSRRGLQNRQRQQQQQRQDTNSFDAAGENDSYNKWLYFQGIKTDIGEKAQWWDGADEVRATPAAGLVVAYGSYDYRKHAMGYLTRGIFCNHQARKAVASLRVIRAI